MVDAGQYLPVKAVSTDSTDIHVDTRFTWSSFAASGRREHAD